MIKIKDFELFEEQKKKFSIKRKSKITKKNLKKINNKKIYKILFENEVDEKLDDRKLTQ